MFNRNLKKVDHQFYRIDTVTVNRIQGIRNLVVFVARKKHALFCRQKKRKKIKIFGKAKRAEECDKINQELTH